MFGTGILIPRNCAPLTHRCISASQSQTATLWTDSQLRYPEQFWRISRRRHRENEVWSCNQVPSIKHIFLSHTIFFFMASNPCPSHVAEAIFLEFKCAQQRRHHRQHFHATGRIVPLVQGRIDHKRVAAVPAAARQCFKRSNMCRQNFTIAEARAFIFGRACPAHAVAHFAAAER